MGTKAQGTGDVWLFLCERSIQLWHPPIYFFPFTMYSSRWNVVIWITLITNGDLIYSLFLFRSHLCFVLSYLTSHPQRLPGMTQKNLLLVIAQTWCMMWEQIKYKNKKVKMTGDEENIDKIWTVGRKQRFSKWIQLKLVRSKVYSARRQKTVNRMANAFG